MRARARARRYFAWQEYGISYGIFRPLFVVWVFTILAKTPVVHPDMADRADAAAVKDLGFAIPVQLVEAATGVQLPKLSRQMILNVVGSSCATVLLYIFGWPLKITMAVALFFSTPSIGEVL